MKESEKALRLKLKLVCETMEAISEEVGVDKTLKNGELVFQRVQALRERAVKAMRALESLTPGESEYVGNIEACVVAIRNARNTALEDMKKFHARAEQAEAERDQLKIENKKLTGCSENGEKEK